MSILIPHTLLYKEIEQKQAKLNFRKLVNSLIENYKSRNFQSRVYTVRGEENFCKVNALQHYFDCWVIYKPNLKLMLTFFKEVPIRGKDDY